MGGAQGLTWPHRAEPRPRDTGHLFPTTSPDSEESGTASPSSLFNSAVLLAYPQVFSVPQLFLQILQKKSWEQEFKASSEPQLLPLQP